MTRNTPLLALLGLREMRMGLVDRMYAPFNAGAARQIETNI